MHLVVEQNPAIAKNLYIRAKLMMKLKERIAAKQLTQAAAAELFGVSQPRKCGRRSASAPLPPSLPHSVVSELVTRNEADFASAPVSLLNPWT
ncbi:MAG: XRE family transcriptional regulator [Desulfobacteraceae bacterium]|jgi:hypothetical protein|nr:XRE family transcriptional regulator [Desulfobacteraceae bacterium]